MTRQMRHYRRRSPNGTRFSDEYLCALTRGLYVPAGRDTRPGRKESHEPGETFEECYPKYPFAPLVRMALGLAGWIRVWRSKETSRAGAARPAITDDGAGE